MVGPVFQLLQLVKASPNIISVVVPQALRFSKPHEKGEEKFTGNIEKERLGHVGTREQYNGKRLGPNYTGGKRNSEISFMFFNFPEEWGMGRLWMIFKKYGTVFDMFMAQRRLRNGQRYGFVRFKFVSDVDGLLEQLQKIRIGDVYLRVFVVHDRKNNGYVGASRSYVRQENKGMYSYHGARFINERKTWNVDNRRFVDVVNGGKDNVERKYDEKETKGRGSRDTNWSGRIITADEHEVNSSLIGRSVVGEVKAACFLSKLLVLCEEQGLGAIEVKLLGGLEVMVVMENETTVVNVLTDKEHRLRRWLYKLRRGDSLQRTSGRVTWISIIGVPIACWGEGVFKKVAALHGTILGMNNCTLEGNQNLVYGRVKIHTINKGLIREEVTVMVKGKNYIVNVVEEVRDISIVNIQEAGGESVEDEGEGDQKVRCEEDGGPAAVFGGRVNGEDKGSRFSGETRVVDTFDGELVSPEDVGYGENKRSNGEEDIQLNAKKCGEYINGDNDNVGIHMIGEQKQTNGMLFNSRECETNIPGYKENGLVVDSSSKVSNGPGNNNEVSGLGNNHGDIGPSNNNLDFRPGNNDENIVKDTNTNGLNDMGDCRGNKRTIRNFIQKKSNLQVEKEGRKLREGNDVTEDEDSISCRRDKRGVSPSSSAVSGGDRLRKKRKASDEGKFEGNEDDMIFNKGKSAEEKGEGKKKTGRKSIKKAFEIARKVGAEGLGDNKKGVSDVYKEYHEVESESNGIFHFGRGKECEGDNDRCNVNIEQVKEIGEMIGVSWALNVRGMGESGKKGWIRSIIKDEHPDVIGLQETKCGMVDDTWVENLWGRQRYRYAQLPAIGNSGGSHKASLWEILVRLMNKWQGAWCIFGDLNVVRRNDDRLNSQVNVKEMTDFNDFINNMSEFEIIIVRSKLCCCAVCLKSTGGYCNMWFCEFGLHMVNCKVFSKDG
ncbi:hypothetical protein CTI12_AA449830 [Artemisia annua]|uniref:Uncharacterized protein n=1 Tax=Artemisia annua TaxID=35608 RepID=A0A2U1LVC9_ARTAN|nr:hypothetical protein CTI12_AA449830 [Artemisia annua]